MIASLVLIALFAAVHFMRPLVSGIKLFPNSIFQSENRRAIHQKIDEANAKYNDDCRKLLETFSSDLEKKVSPEFEKAEKSVPKVVEELCSFRVCLKLFYKAVKDRLFGTNDFEKAYREIMDVPVIQPCLYANIVANNMLQNLQLRLKERSSQYAMELATVCRGISFDNKPLSKNLEKFQTRLDEFSGSVQKFHMEKIVSSTGAVIEIIFFRESCKYILKLFAKPTLRICGSLGGAFFCVIADGPLPFLDIAGAVIAVGGLIWTAWDLYNVFFVLPKKLNLKLRNSIRETKASLLEESKRKARSLVNEYQFEGRVLKDNLKENF